MKQTGFLYNSLTLLIFCVNIIVVFSVVYVLFDLTGLGRLVEVQAHPSGLAAWAAYLARTMYFSAMTLFSVGYGDIWPVGWSRAVAVIEATVGYILPAVVAAQYLRVFPTRWKS